MRTFILAFVAGVCLLQSLADLPDQALLFRLLAAGSGIGLLGCAVRGQKSAAVVRHWRGLLALVFVLTLAGGLLGFVWAGFNAHWRMAESLPVALEGRDLTVEGVIATLPENFEHGVRFELDVLAAPAQVPGKLRLSWYAPRPGTETAEERSEEASAPTPADVRAGERWQFVLRLKRPHGSVNPHGFDYEAWLLERGVRATGYVRPSGEKRLAVDASGFGYRVQALRQDIRERLLARLSTRTDGSTSELTPAPYAAVLVALAIGDQSGIPFAQWQLYAKTGITHLVSISGLHVTMLAALAYGLSAWLWRLLARSGGARALWLLRFPLPVVGAVFGWLAAAAYCLLAGFAVPAQRTLYMLTVVALALITRRHVGVSRILALALLAVVLLDPWAVLSAGFWLSFGAVGFLLLGAGAQPERGQKQGSTVQMVLAGGRAWLRAQWAVTLGMLPVLLALFGQFSLISPVANAVAIPVISFVVTPLVLFDAMTGLDLFLVTAHAITAGLMAGMQWLAGLPYALWQQATPPLWCVALGLVGASGLLLPRFGYWRVLGLLCFAPLLLWQPARPVAGAAIVRVLDVGQGLAIHVQTATHDLLFDTGPAFSSEADSGNRILVPYLRALGVTRLDTLVISHGDADHAGGALSVLGALPVGQMLHSLTSDSPVLQAAEGQIAHTPCRAGDVSEWDGVRLAWLYPYEAPEQIRRRNARACVLRIEAAGHAMLLPSDIEAAQESAVVTRQGSDQGSELRADVLVAPHHGSRTSSTPEFIAAVAPQIVIFPVGYRNRFGHPKDDVVERYRQRGSELARTDADGALSVRLSADGVSMTRERLLQRRYWHDG